MKDDEFAPYDNDDGNFWIGLASAVVILVCLAIAAHSFWSAFSG